MIKPNFVTKKLDVQDSYGKFSITPLPAGFGHSMGNALRRTLFSSIEGAAGTYVKINDVVHPFSTIEGVKESGLDIILNLKQLRFNVTGDGPYVITLNAKGTGKVHASDFKGGDVRIVNGDQFIAELTSPKAKLDIELTVEKGLGFSPSEEKENKSFGTLSLDSVFSPVKKVNYKVEAERVGRKTNYDRLIIEIWTDATITPEESLHDASNILGNFFSHLLSGKDDEEEQIDESQRDSVNGQHVDDKVFEIIIDELDLPTRVINALLREKIETVGDLVERGKEELVNLKGVGRKSITLVEKELTKLGINLE